MSGNEFRFILSRDVNLPVTVRIERLEGALPQSPPAADVYRGNKSQELYVECALFNDGTPFGLSSRTRLESSGQPYCWGEQITLNAKYRDLTAHAQLALTVWDVSCGNARTVVGGATILLFNRKKKLKTGKHKLCLWLGKEADGSFPSSTPGKVPRNDRSELDRLEKLVNKYERSQIRRIDWLDNLSFKAIEKIREKESGTSHLSLLVDFCSFGHRVVFQTKSLLFSSCS